jgi:peptidoglycan/LPS O-acetylase OafA/YrhL
LALNPQFKFTKMLGGNDCSYGLYIYHGIILNLFVHLNFTDSIFYFFIYLAISFFLALFSWKFIEERFLKLKSKPIKI